MKNIYKRLLTLFVFAISLGIGQAWGATTAPTGAAHTPGTTTTVTANNRNYEVFFSNNASQSSLLVGSNTSSTTQSASTSSWINIGSSCGNNNNNIATAFTFHEFVSNVKNSNNKAIRVQSLASSERNVVMVVSGYDSISVLAKSNDLSVYAEIYSNNSYGASSALTLATSTNKSSHYRRSFALDNTKQYRLTIAYGTTGSTNKDLVAFSLCVPSNNTYYYRGADNSWGATAMTVSDGGLYEYISSTTNNHLFKISESTSSWEHNSDKIKAGFCMTGITTIADDGTNDHNCKITSAPASYYIIVFKPNTALNSSSDPVICASATLPDDSSAGLAATKTIYFTPNDNWKDASAKFAINGYGHDNDYWSAYMTQSPCDATKYSVDIPALYSDIIIVRLDPSGSKDWDGKWNQTGNLRIPSGNNCFTLASGVWNDATTTWSAYTPSTYTISFAAGSGSGSMSNIGNISCGSNQTIPANSFTAPSGYQFAGWKANVDVKVGGVIKTAGTVLADEVTIQDISSNITLTAQWEEKSCPTDGTVYSAVTTATGNVSIAASASNLALNTSTHKTTVTGGSMSVYNGQTNDKNLITSSGFCMTNNNTYFRIDLDCELEAGDVISVDVGKDGSNERGVWISTATERPSSAPACALTTINSNLVPVTYTVTGSDAYHGNSTFYIYRATGNTTYFNNISITRSSACGATQPGVISKSLSACTLTLTADGSAASGDTWYWQSAANGTDKTGTSGATNTVNATGTYYIRSYNTAGDCWSEAQSVTVSASDLTPATPSALAASSPTAKGVTLTVTDAANTNDYEFYVSTNSTAPTSGTSASYTVTSGKSITITDKYAGTTCYAWARAKCGSYKSAWTALTGSTFTTSTVTMTPTLTNVTHETGATTGIGGSDYTATFAGATDYALPSTITVTIDGNAATSGTDYTWTQGTGTLTIPAAKITGNIAVTITSEAAAPSSVAISGEYHYFPGETIELTATPTGGNGPMTYQWYHGGKADGNAIEGATSATYTKATCAFEDAGSYYCKVTGGGSSVWAETNSAENYDVKILRLYVKTGKYNGNSKTDYGNVDFSKGDGTTATASISLGANWDYCFNIADGCGHYYGYNGEMTEGNSTDWTMNVNNQDCGLRTTNGATYVFTIDYSNLSAVVLTVTYPSGNQAADKIIYYDNSVLNWTVTPYYRIGRADHTQANLMTLVHGTANLYQYTTTEYNNFTGWHIANNSGWTGSNSIYRTYTNGDQYSITYATAHEGGAVTQAAVTVTPTTSRGNGADSGLNDNCEFYNYDLTTGMKTDNVSITAPTNGTITVAYTDPSNASQSFASGNADLAHTCIITPTATPATGYNLGGLTVNETAHASGTAYTITGATTVAATFTAKTTAITLKTGAQGSGADKTGITATYDSGSLTGMSGVHSATGYTLEGYYTAGGIKVLDNTGALVHTATDYTTAGGLWKCTDETLTLTAHWTVNNYDLTWDLAGGTVTTAGTGASVDATGTPSSSVAYGTALTAPVVAKTGYNFSAWSPLVASTMPAAATTYTATWTANQYNVSTSLTDMTVSSGTTGTNAATYGTNYSLTLAANSGYSLPATITVTIGGSTKTQGTEYAYDSSTGVVTITGSYILGNINITAAGVELKYTVTYAANGGSGSVPTDATEYDPNDEVTVLGKNTLSKSGYTFMGWTDANSHFYVEGDKFNITGNTTLTAVWDGSSTKYYHGSITITNGALTPGSTGSHKGFFTNTGGTIATSTAISLTPTPGEGGYYYESSTLTDAALGNSSNWASSSTSNRTIRSFKYKSGDTYTLALGSNVATSIKFYGYNGSASKTMTVGDVSWTCSSTKNTFDTHDFTKSGGFTGNVSITQDGDFYGILVITCNTYTGKKVSFDKGSGPSTVSGLPADRYVPSGSKIIQPSTEPTAANYIFNGWVTTSGGSTAFDFANTTITSNTTIYAKWTAKTAPTSYTVSTDNATICSGNTTNVKLSGSQSGITYKLLKDGVDQSQDKTGTGSALTWTGIDAAGTYTVKTIENSTYAEATMSGSAVITILATTAITTQPTTAVSGHASVNFTLGEEMVAEGASLTYKWYSYTSSGGAGEAVVGGATSATYTTSKSAGTYYYKVEVSGTCGSPVKSNMITITVDNNLQLTYNANNGSGAPAAEYVAPGSSTTLSSIVPTRDGYVFLGWNTNASGTGDMYQPGASFTMPSTVTTLYAAWASPCFSFSKGTKDTEPTDGFVMTPSNINSSAFSAGATLSGGTLTNTSGATLAINGKYGFVMVKSTRELTLTLTGGQFQEGTVIALEGYTNSNSTVHTYGFSVGGNAAGDPITATASSYDAIKQRYVVTAGDGVEGTSVCTITMNTAGTGTQTYLSAIYIGGCVSCTPITPTLTYSATTLYAFGGTPGTATPTLTGNTGSGSVTYSSSNTDAVTVDSSSGVITAVGVGSATISARIAASGGNCGAVATCNITVPALVTQTINVGSSTPWGTPPNMTFNDPTSTTTQGTVIANTGYTFNVSSNGSARDERGMTAAFTASENDMNSNKYLSLTFTNNSHNIRFGEVVVPIQPISNNGKAKVTLSDGTTTMTSTEVTGITQGKITDVHFTFPSEQILSAGTITLKIYFYGQTAGFRLASPILVNGGVLTDYTFTTAGNWTEASKWSEGFVPLADDNVIINAAATVNTTGVQANNVTIGEGTLEITTAGMLKVNGTLTNTDASKLTVNIPGGIAIGDGMGSVRATVNFHSKSGKADGKYRWQAFGWPLQDQTDVHGPFGQSWIMYYLGNDNWDYVNNGQYLTPFQGYLTTHKGDAATGKNYTFAGTLNGDAEKTLSFSYYTGDKWNFFANSWLSPIDVTKFTSTDFSNAEATFYVLNTGSQEEQGTLGGENTGLGNNAGQYTTITPDLASATAENSLIAPAQGFFVAASASSNASVTLNYSKHVLASMASHTSAATMRAPRREQAENEVPSLLTINVVGEENNFGDVMHILSAERYSSESYNNGADGRKAMGMFETSPQIMAQAEYGDMAILATPDVDGTLIGFRAGTADTQYTLRFSGNMGQMYLTDLVTNTETLVGDGSEYTFTAENTDEVMTRFRLNRSTQHGGITTDIEDGTAGGVKVFVRDGEVELVWNNEQGAKNKDIRLYDATGKLLYEEQGTRNKEQGASGVTLRFTLPQQGVYLLRIGTATRKIVW